MADNTIKMGDDYRLSHDTAGNWSTPTWVDQELVDDITVESSRAVAELKKRGKDFVSVLTGKETKSISFTILLDPADTFVGVLETNYRTPAAIHLALANGAMATSGTKYWHFWGRITELAETVGQDDAAMYSVTIRPDGNKENDPAFAAIA